jgi:hypothetical protein
VGPAAAGTGVSSDAGGVGGGAAVLAAGAGVAADGTGAGAARFGATPASGFDWARALVTGSDALAHAISAETDQSFVKAGTSTVRE